MKHDHLSKYFDYVWRRLALGGWCDDEGGAEWRRVKDLWAKGGKPQRVAGFIRAHANRPSSCYWHPIKSFLN